MRTPKHKSNVEEKTTTSRDELTILVRKVHHDIAECVSKSSDLQPMTSLSIQASLKFRPPQVKI